MDDREYASISSTAALLNDIQMIVLRAAMNHGIYPESKRELMNKIDWLKDHVSQIPERKISQ